MNRAIIACAARLVMNTFLLVNADYSYVILQGANSAVAELACGIICSCLFIPPRLYRHVTRQPPVDSEEYRLRRYKKLASEKHIDESRQRQVHYQEEARNPWERNIEGTVV